MSSEMYLPGCLARVQGNTRVQSPGVKAVSSVVGCLSLPDVENIARKVDDSAVGRGQRVITMDKGREQLIHYSPAL